MSHLMERKWLEMIEASKDSLDPLRHGLIIITDSKKKFKKQYRMTPVQYAAPFTGQAKIQN